MGGENCKRKEMRGRWSKTVECRRGGPLSGVRRDYSQGNLIMEGGVFKEGVITDKSWKRVRTGREEVNLTVQKDP